MIAPETTAVARARQANPGLFRICFLRVSPSTRRCVLSAIGFSTPSSSKTFLFETTVKKGDLLVQFDKKPYQVQVNIKRVAEVRRILAKHAGIDPT
jgi:hypothetical protein